ncbi:hypothetical protein ABBQ32_14148 [Trebouxia sp. C0010 RCD-2024]
MAALSPSAKAKPAMIDSLAAAFFAAISQSLQLCKSHGWGASDSGQSHFGARSVWCSHQRQSELTSIAMHLSERQATTIFGPKGLQSSKMTIVSAVNRTVDTNWLFDFVAWHLALQ